MFYVDFTAPDGTAYRIDLSEHPITYTCPVCGNQQFFMPDDSDPDWCGDCRKRQQEQEKRERDQRFRQNTITRVNRLCDSNIDDGTLDSWIAEVKEKSLSPEDQVAFFRKKIKEVGRTQS